MTKDIMQLIIQNVPHDAYNWHCVLYMARKPHEWLKVSWKLCFSFTHIVDIAWFWLPKKMATAVVKYITQLMFQNVFYVVLCYIPKKYQQ